MTATSPANFQSDATWQGNRFAEQCMFLLNRQGLEIDGAFMIPQLGVEIDCHAYHPSTGTSIYLEFKGSYQGNRPGLRRTDTVKKAIANGALLKTMDPAPHFVVFTSHLPAANSAGDFMLRTALDYGLIDAAVCVNNPEHLRRFFTDIERGQFALVP